MIYYHVSRGDHTTKNGLPLRKQQAEVTASMFFCCCLRGAWWGAYNYLYVRGLIFVEVSRVSGLDDPDFVMSCVHNHH